MNRSEQVVTESRHPGTAYHHQGHPVCARMYRFLNTVGELKTSKGEHTKHHHCKFPTGVDNLISMHGNTHRLLPKNTLSHEDIPLELFGGERSSFARASTWVQWALISSCCHPVQASGLFVDYGSNYYHTLF